MGWRVNAGKEMYFLKRLSDEKTLFTVPLK